ncbi:MAG TPA: hypothetical protein VGD01_04970 [Candidatus Elarobacter sp.]|jgi:hypothetical protein
MGITESPQEPPSDLERLVREVHRHQRVISIFLMAVSAMLIVTIGVALSLLTARTSAHGGVPAATATGSPAPSSSSSPVSSQGPLVPVTRATRVEAPMGFDTILSIAVLVCVAAIVAILIVLGDRNGLVRAAQAATVFIPVAALAEFYAYLFNVGWANRFGFPLWRVPLKASPPTVVLAGIVTFIGLGFIAWWFRAPPDEKRTIPGNGIEETAQPKNVDAANYSVPIPEKGRVAAILWIAALIPISLLSGRMLLQPPYSSWTYIQTGCVVVATFGDTMVAADVDADHRVATDFTVYRGDAFPQSWQSGEFVLPPASADSALYHRPIFECPAPAADEKPAGTSGGSPSARPTASPHGSPTTRANARERIGPHR